MLGADCYLVPYRPQSSLLSGGPATLFKVSIHDDGGVRPNHRVSVRTVLSEFRSPTKQITTLDPAARDSSTTTTPTWRLGGRRTGTIPTVWLLLSTTTVRALHYVAGQDADEEAGCLIILHPHRQRNSADSECCIWSSYYNDASLAAEGTPYIAKPRDPLRHTSCGFWYSKRLVSNNRTAIEGSNLVVWCWISLELQSAKKGTDRGLSQ